EAMRRKLSARCLRESNEVRTGIGSKPDRVQKMKSKEALHKGNLVAEVLSGSWRSSAIPTLQLTEAQLDAVMPLLYDSGTAALGWHRLKATPLRTSTSAEVLHQAYRLQSLQSEVH